VWIEDLRWWFSCISARLWVIKVTKLLPMKANKICTVDLKLTLMKNFSFCLVSQHELLIRFEVSLKDSSVHFFLLLIKMKQYIYIFLLIIITFLISIKANKILFVVCAHIINPKYCKILTFYEHLILDTFFPLLAIEKNM